MLISRALKDVRHVYIWNGQNDHHRILIRAAESLQIPVTYLEVGYFPQREFYVMDSKGINATAYLMEDDLSWVDDGHLSALKSLRGTYLRGRSWTGGGGYTLIPLQLERDTNVRDHADFAGMQEFIDHCESTLEGLLLFKAHPRDTSVYRSQSGIVTNGSFLDLAERCEGVVGLNSTCLLESALMGVPTKVLGRGFLQAHEGQEERLLAALVERQVPVGATDISFWIERFSSKDRETCGSV
jgi:capsule polysaccharide modification protein KpsS